MALYILDASALVKYYIREPGSIWVRHIFDHVQPEDTARTGS